MDEEILVRIEKKINIIGTILVAIIIGSLLNVFEKYKESGGDHDAISDFFINAHPFFSGIVPVICGLSVFLLNKKFFSSPKK